MGPKTDALQRLVLPVGESNSDLPRSCYVMTSEHTSRYTNGKGYVHVSAGGGVCGGARAGAAAEMRRARGVMAEQWSCRGWLEWEDEGPVKQIGERRVLADQQRPTPLRPADTVYNVCFMSVRSEVAAMEKAAHVGGPEDEALIR